MLSYTQDETGQWWAHYGNPERRARVTPQNCEACGKEYVRYGKPGRFCSRACAGATIGNEAIRRRPSYICEQCGKPFWTPDAHRGARFCSRPCRITAQSGKYRKPEHPRECPVCGTMFQRELGKSWRKTCGNAKCRRAVATPSGEDHPNWKGGTFIDPQGYVRVLGRLEHRVVMEQVLGRPLERFEEVHHKNAIRSDNRPENLELWVKRQPGGARARDLIDYARWVLETYESLEDKL